MLVEQSGSENEIDMSRRGARLRSPHWVYLLIALLLRIWLIVHTRGVIDGDEAVFGIQAEHILRGEHPVYFYGQVYMGSLEAYLVAILFAIFGSSVWVLRSEPVLLSLVLVFLTWKLAAVLAAILCSMLFHEHCSIAGRYCTALRYCDHNAPAGWLR